ncbi:MAG: hypothetical protein LBD96_01255 [Treponema sp.]|nr:hypothetical protein [Treponema sp.]
MIKNRFPFRPLQTGFPLFRVFVVTIFILGFPVSSPSQSSPASGKSEWYVSNAAGMALERAESRFAALRRPYCLLIEEQDTRGLPASLLPYYREPWIVERRIHYKDGEESRVQWIFRDGRGTSRMVAVFGVSAGGTEEDGDAADAVDAESGAGVPSGFIELYGANGLIELERQLFDTGEETLVEYYYRRSPSGEQEFLIRADTRRKLTDGEGNGIEEDLYTDYYRYTRNYSLRTVERVFHQGADAADAAGAGNAGDTAAAAAGAGNAGDTTAAAAAESDTETGAESGTEGLRTTMRFPRRSLDSKDEELFVSPAIAYGSQFLEDAHTGSSGQLVYETDERGRILTETMRGEDGEIITELRNQWSGNRLSRIIYTSPGGEERITEYDYNDEGDRITERNFRNGILERVVHISGNIEDEEIYMDGELVLRTRWEGGRKIREERVRAGRTGAGTAVPRGEP